MLILADKYIPFLRGILEPFARVSYLEPEEFTPAAVKDADALLVRTRTRCDATLLSGSRVRFIATATIGYDHIDTDYCDRHGIFLTNAPGCNAQGVCDYIEAALRYIESTLCHISATTATIGVIGVGHVGSLVAACARRRGYHVLLNDPPREEAEASATTSVTTVTADTPAHDRFCPLDTIAREADIITFHTPLTRHGKYPTWHLCDDIFLRMCKPGVVIINAARGGVIDEEALLQTSNNNRLPAPKYIIDTWQNEPHINKNLLDRALIGTYHIAGYTLQGKINATNICLAALCRHFSLPDLSVSKEALPLHTPPEDDWLLAVDRQLRAHPDDFETLRESYPLR